MTVTAPKKGSRAARKRALSTRLLEVAQDYLSGSESYSEISVDRLTSLAGVSRSNFYVYFEDKAELLQGWLSEIFEDIIEAGQAWWAIDELSTREDLRSALSGIVHAYRTNARIVSLILDFSARETPVSTAVNQMLRENTLDLARHITIGQARGFVNPRLEPREASIWIDLMAERVFNRILPTADDSRVESMIDTYTEIVWSTLYESSHR